ncbi:LysR family transcriptional regulator [Marinomonas sp. PE14-40]|uniref:LysR family transcriptional regulator n=1 Tax=Marinomonas sp. PE14-40 TaxID=3060621 RepID=UPI003F66A983
MKKNNINIMMLRTLVSLRETKSISRTAEQLNVTQSAISHTVRALETAINTPVIVREPRGVTLTAAGMNACESADIALNAIDNILSLSDSSVSGVVKLASIVSASRVIVPEVITHLSREYPKVEVALLIGTDAEVKEWVELGIADVGLAYDFEAEETNILFEDQFYLVCAYNQPQQTKVTLADLDNKAFIMSSAGCEPAIQTLFKQANLTLDVKTKVFDMSALFAIVSSDYGISLVPGLAFPSNWRQLVMRKPLTPQLNLNLCLISTNQKSNKRLTDLLHSSVKLVADSLRAQ